MALFKVDEAADEEICVQHCQVCHRALHSPPRHTPGIECVFQQQFCCALLCHCYFSLCFVLFWFQLSLLCATSQDGSVHCVDALLAPGCYIVPTTGVSYDAPEFEDAPDSPTDDSCVTRSVIAALGGCHVFVLDAKDLVNELGDAWMVSKKRRLLTRYTEELLPLFLQRVPFFKGIPSHDVSSAARRFTVVSFAAGTTIVAEGSRSDAFYVVIHGEYTVSVRGKKVFQGAIGDFFGEIGLLQDVPATASVIAKRDTLVMVQHRSAFHGMLEAIPSLRESIQSHVASRQASSVQKLKSDLFATMSESQLNRLTQRIKYTSVGGGTVISDYGADPTTAYVVAQGSVSYAERSSVGSDTVSLKASGAAAGTDALLPRASALGRQRNFKLFTTDSAAVVVKLKRSDIEYTFAGDSAGLGKFELYAHGALPPLPAVLKVEEAREVFEAFVGAVLRLKRPMLSALADGLGFLSLPHAIAQATGGKVLPTTAGAKDASLEAMQKLNQADKRDYLQKLPVTVPTKIVSEFVMACDDVASMAFSASPQGDPIVGPSRGLAQLFASTVSKFCGSAHSPGTAIGAILPPTEVARLTGLAASPFDTLKLSPYCTDASLAVVLAGLNLTELYAQFQATEEFKAVMRTLQASHSIDSDSGRSRSGSTAGPPKGTTPRIPVGKMNRYGQWQQREMCVDMDKKQISVYDEKGLHTHAYPLIDFARVERVSAEPDQ
jgi:CRP-like cAMP-binding protein